MTCSSSSGVLNYITIQDKTALDIQTSDIRFSQEFALQQDNRRRFGFQVNDLQLQ
jgi:hypothetical protein